MNTAPDYDFLDDSSEDCNYIKNFTEKCCISGEQYLKVFDRTTPFMSLGHNEEYVNEDEKVTDTINFDDNFVNEEKADEEEVNWLTENINISGPLNEKSETFFAKSPAQEDNVYFSTFDPSDHEFLRDIKKYVIEQAKRKRKLIETPILKIGAPYKRRYSQTKRTDKPGSFYRRKYGNMTLKRTYKVDLNSTKVKLCSDKPTWYKNLQSQDIRNVYSKYGSPVSQELHFGCTIDDNPSHQIVEPNTSWVRGRKCMCCVCRNK